MRCCSARRVQHCSSVDRVYDVTSMARSSSTCSSASRVLLSRPLTSLAASNAVRLRTRPLRIVYASELRCGSSSAIELSAADGSSSESSASRVAIHLDAATSLTSCLPSRRETSYSSACTRLLLLLPGLELLRALSGGSEAMWESSDATKSAAASELCASDNNSNDAVDSSEKRSMARLQRPSVQLRSA